MSATLTGYLGNIASLLVGGVLVFYLQSRIRIREQKETSDIRGAETAALTPMQVMERQLQAKDQQLLLAQQTMGGWVETQMARNDAQTKAILELAAQVRGQTENLKDVGAALQAHREEASARSGRVYEKIGEVNERLATIEGGIRNSLDTAQRAAEAALQAVREARAPGRPA